MGSKKHKKESKKKKHRSRSRSPTEAEDRERKRHRKHKDRKKDRSPDVEEVPVDSHLVPKSDGNGTVRSRSRSSSEERDRRMREQQRSQKRDDSDSLKEKSNDRERERSPLAGGGGGGGGGGGAQESLSVEETNRLRVKLGLKPLDLPEKPADDGKFKDDLGEFYHKPAANIAQQKKSEKIREKLEERKEKRKLEQKLQTTLLAEGSDEDDTAAWVTRSREMDKQKQEAAKRAAMLDEMDAVFGVSALVAEEEREVRARSYSARELRGLRVAHDLDALGDERETVLTLADKEVLAEDDEDVLVNVNIVDDERYKKNVSERKKARAGYQAYDEEAELAAAAEGPGAVRPVLAKYDDELDPARAATQHGFVIGDDDALNAKKFRDMMRQERLQGSAERRLESLQLPTPRLATDYLDHHELQAKFKKTKKRGKIRKKVKEEPIDVDDYEAGSAPMITDDTEVDAEQLRGGLVVDEEETEPDTELQAALGRARRLRQAEAARRAPAEFKVEEILERAKEEQGPEEPAEGSMVLDATAEFCRTLGDIPTYGLAGNRDHHAEIMELEREEADADMEEPGGAGGAGAGAGAWSRVDAHAEAATAAAGGTAGAGAAGATAALEAEPALGAGVAGALRLALSKGYLERAGAAPAPRAAPHALQAAVYSIEDKAHGEDERGGGGGGGGGGRRERGAAHSHAHSGPLQDFREKTGFRPAVKLEYVDDDGRPLCPKEAFRYLSHKFHGKGPGKNKQEKRIKKAVQEGLMKKMSSTDTPLGTLQMLQDKQRETHSPYIVLSGAKRDANN